MRVVGVGNQGEECNRKGVNSRIQLPPKTVTLVLSFNSTLLTFLAHSRKAALSEGGSTGDPGLRPRLSSCFTTAGLMTLVKRPLLWVADDPAPESSRCAPPVDAALHLSHHASLRPLPCRGLLYTYDAAAQSKSINPRCPRYTQKTN